VVNRKLEPLVRTIKGKCRACYTCVRECPAKAIRIVEGQAEVIPHRCIGCGNCVRVCSQGAKVVQSSIIEVQEILQSGDRVAAIIAPSFPADFYEMDYREFVGKIRALGFDLVNEVGFGADLVGRKMRELLEQSNDRHISSACPAVFGYIKRYHPELIDKIAPVVSPMVATARALHEIHGKDLRMIFIGPCVAKMGEAYSQELEGEIDEVLTFQEIHQMFEKAHTLLEDVTPSDFDPPHAGRGNLFPIRRGLLEAAGITEDLISGEVVSANGRTNFIDAIMEFGSGDLDARLLDVLCCDGCIMGAGMRTKYPLYRRRTLVSNHVRKVSSRRDPAVWQAYMDQFEELDLSRVFIPNDQRIADPAEEAVIEILQRLGKVKPDDELNCGACGYETCREHAIAIYKGLAESEMCLPYTIERLHNSIRELNLSHENLDKTKAALIQAEKMASMGQLAAGIAHEVNNPLGVVLMYAHLLAEEVDQKSEMADDLKMIVEQADRCKNIVSGLLNFARQNKVSYKTVNVTGMVENFLKTVQTPANITLTFQNELGDNSGAEIDHDQIIQVITNLVNNSLTALPDGGEVRIKASADTEWLYLEISDTGCGIPKDHLTKIFEPFFTTKKLGLGTGLGLSIIYGIVKMHNGDIRVDSNCDLLAGPTGTNFRITLPRKKRIKKIESC